MRVRMLVVIALVAAAGCGPDFRGSFAGYLVDHESCADGTGFATAAAFTFTVAAQKGGGLAVSIGNPGCDPLLAIAGGNVATIPATACPPTTSVDGITSTLIVHGSLTLSEPNLSVVLDGHVDFSGGFTGQCDDQVTGVLGRIAP